MSDKVFDFLDEPNLGINLSIALIHLYPCGKKVVGG